MKKAIAVKTMALIWEEILADFGPIIEHDQVFVKAHFKKSYDSESHSQC